MFRRQWSAAEVEALGKFYSGQGPTRLAVVLCRSEDSVSSEARRLGLRSTLGRRRQALTQARQNRSVNIHFFDEPSPEVAFVLGYLWVRSTVRTTPKHILRLQ